MTANKFVLKKRKKATYTMPTVFIIILNSNSSSLYNIVYLVDLIFD